MYQSSAKFYSACMLCLVFAGLLLCLSACKKKDEPVTPSPGGTSPPPGATPPPTISGFSPASGAVGTVVVITGSNFSTIPSQNTVKFNGRPATVTAATATQLTVTIPEGARDGIITVEVGGKTASSASAFDYTEVVTVSTLAGSTVGYADGTGSAARFNGPTGVAVDGSGNIYVADSQNHRIRKITPAGLVSTLAGSTFGYADGTGSEARFSTPNGVAVDGSGNVYVSEYSNHRIRKITPTGQVTTLAGSTRGYADGGGTNARFDSPEAVAVDGSGNLYVADAQNHRIRKITPEGVVSTLAGSTPGYADGSGSAAKFHGPNSVAIDGSGNLYVFDWNNFRIRKVTPAGVVTTLAGSTQGYVDGIGSAAKFNLSRGVAIDGSGNIYVCDYGNLRIRKVTPAGVVSTLAGSGELGNTDGTGSTARFHGPYSVAVDGSGNLYVAEIYNHRIRKITIR